MKELRLQIKEALDALIYAQNDRPFQWLAVQVAKTKWPEIEATQENKDGGEDGTSFFTDAKGLKRSMACSLTGTLRKINDDAGRIRGRGVKIDCLVFITPVQVSNVTVAEWCQAIKDQFSHELHIIPQAELIAILEQPKNAWMCREFLKIDFSDAPDIAALEALARRQQMSV